MEKPKIITGGQRVNLEVVSTETPDANEGPKVSIRPNRAQRRAQGKRMLPRFMRKLNWTAEHRAEMNLRRKPDQ